MNHIWIHKVILAVMFVVDTVERVKKKKKNVMQGHRSWPVTVTVARDKLGQMSRGVWDSRSTLGGEINMSAEIINTFGDYRHLNNSRDHSRRPAETRVLQHFWYWGLYREEVWCCGKRIWYTYDSRISEEQFSEAFILKMVKITGSRGVYHHVDKRYVVVYSSWSCPPLDPVIFTIFNCVVSTSIQTCFTIICYTPLSCNLYTQFPVEISKRKGKRKSFVLPSRSDDLSFFGNAHWFLNSPVLSWPTLPLTPATLISPVRLPSGHFSCSKKALPVVSYNLFLSPDLTLFFCLLLLLLLPAFIHHLLPFSWVSSCWTA